MKRITSAIILVLALFSIKGDAHAQSIKNAELTSADSLKTIVAKSNEFQLGLQVEYVLRTGYSSQMNYEYKPVLIQLEFQKPLSRKAGKGFQWEYFIQPQFNTVKFRELGTGMRLETVRTYEAGVNAGLIALKPLISVGGSKYIKLYALGSLGPHYIGQSPSRQAKGFLFSDNFRIGLRVPVSPVMVFDMRTGIRHLSNASLKSPNGGLDDIMFGAGISFVKGQSK